MASKRGNQISSTQSLINEATDHIKRIEKLVKKAEKEGYQFSTNVIPALPKRIKPGTIRKLSKIGIAEIRNKATVKPVTAKPPVPNKPKTPEEQEAIKHINRIKRFVRAAQKRGYTFPDSVIPKLPKHVKPETVERLNKIRPQTLYKKAVYISPEGVKIKGYVRKHQEMSEASRKAAATRKQFAEARNAVAAIPISEAPEDFVDESGEYWWDDEREARYQEYLQESADRDEADDQLLQYYRDQIGKVEPLKESTVVIDNFAAEIQSLDDLIFIMDNREIDERWSRDPKDPLYQYKNADFGYLQTMLEKRIAEQGEEAVSAAIQANASRISELVSSILYESGDKYHRTGREGMNVKIQEIATIIKGAPLTANESMEITSMGERRGLYEE